MDEGIYVERFWNRVHKGSEHDCWLWTGCRNNVTGYGVLWTGRQVTVHRFAYALLVGQIPSGSHLHHQCNNRLCVNPAHLQILDRATHGRIHGHSSAALRWANHQPRLKPDLLDSEARGRHISLGRLAKSDIYVWREAARRGYSIKDIARMTGYAYHSVQNRVSGSIPTGALFGKRLSECLGIPQGQLFTRLACG